MRFNLVDRIVEVSPGHRLRAVKNLTLGEEYLADHFPTFPVMPGVLMLQAVAEASAWLWRVTTEFQHTVVVLREVKNCKYGTFMPPGQTLELATELVKAQLLALHLGRLKDEGLAHPVQISVAKRNNVREALKTAHEARSVLGANGITLEYPISRHSNNLESVYTYEGTDDIHTLIIGQAITGENAFS